MSTLTITLDGHVMARLQTLAAERRASVHAVVVEAIETAIQGQAEKARQRLLDLIDMSQAEIGPIVWKRGDLYDR